MVLESTMLCVDNSDYMRNGDFVPTRLQSQIDAVNLVCHSKARSNPENNVGLLTMANLQVLVTLTSEIGRIHSKLVQVQPSGTISIVKAVLTARLALKHRQGKNHRMRIVVFVGSPVLDDEKELTKLAKRLKKENVSADIVNFGEEKDNTEKLKVFINTLNGKDGTGSHLVTVPAGTMLSDALMSSAIIGGEDGSGVQSMAGFEFGIDPNEDPELALALRVSMEEQRARQEAEAKKIQADSSPADAAAVPDADDQMLQKALEMSMETEAAERPKEEPNVDAMTEEEQLAYAQQLSLQQPEEPMDVGERSNTDATEAAGDDYTEVMNDPEFLHSVLGNLPGVDPESEAIRNAMDSMTKDKKEDKEKKK
ncbi:DgyrCDS7033 [Dimorphilus gyrociliatus]|uniref:26S proteasome non-ATPase regulatory subunit 4 n=1 Tax=Dimorphilus gyrociliatus TaxID=2664684 RepID=A0A7I8VS31_9ANNE|nr:DgyrCDS7033 [Dimorphilus gyrociliatus]